MITSLIKLTTDLINQPSITPNDHNCQKIIAHYLKKLHFNIEFMNFNDTNNIWAYHCGPKKKYQKQYTLLFLGHTDVVPPGNIQDWNYPPFKGVIDNNTLYGRGASDMKGALSAMLVATKYFIQKYPDHPNRIAFLITSDEEGTGTNGTVKVIESLLNRNERIDYCIIGEPSSQVKIGDTIKNGRRGSYTGQLTIKGLSGHVAYPQFLKNPIHLTIPILSKLLKITWDHNHSTLFPPTSMQIIDIHTTPIHNINNVTPDTLILKFNFRFSKQSSINTIQNNINRLLLTHCLNYQITWSNPIEPYFSNPGKLTNTVINIIKNYHKINPKIETTGGTSDGRFIIKTGSEILELGALNKTIHKANECIKLKDLELLSNMYLTILQKILL